jgi:hypothetical protein
MLRCNFGVPFGYDYATLNVTITGCIVENVSGSSIDGKVVSFDGINDYSTLLIKNTAFKNISEIGHGCVYIEGIFQSASIFIYLIFIINNYFLRYTRLSFCKSHWILWGCYFYRKY